MYPYYPKHTAFLHSTPAPRRAKNLISLTCAINFKKQSQKCHRRRKKQFPWVIDFNEFLTNNIFLHSSYTSQRAVRGWIKDLLLFRWVSDRYVTGGVKNGENSPMSKMWFDLYCEEGTVSRDDSHVDETNLISAGEKACLRLNDACKPLALIRCVPFIIRLQANLYFCVSHLCFIYWHYLTSHSCIQRIQSNFKDLGLGVNGGYVIM